MLDEIKAAQAAQALRLGRAASQLSIALTPMALGA